jgi:glycosyltransferase involved in cell wall biosynthesis
MKIALVHDYLNEFGGAERVLKTLTKMYPEAPIYTAFCVKESTAWNEFKGSKIVESWLAPILKIGKLYSPLRFLTPAIWGSFDFSEYDVVISSASWYITKGIDVPRGCFHLSYIHTPPRYLYGYKTAIEWQRYFLIRFYAKLIGGYLRKYDFESAQKPDLLIANSNNVKGRIKKYYNRDSKVIYPPVQVRKIYKKTKDLKKQDYWLVVSRVVGAKGIDLAMEAANKLNLNLKIVGESAGLAWEEKKLKKLKTENMEFLGRLSDKELWCHYGRAAGFLALASDEDFGMTVPEAIAAGTPVVAYRGGGYLETVKEGVGGEFFDKYTLGGLIKAIKKVRMKTYERKKMYESVLRLDESNFEKEIKALIEKEAKN